MRLPALRRFAGITRSAVLAGIMCGLAACAAAPGPAGPAQPAAAAPQPAAAALAQGLAVRYWLHDIESIPVLDRLMGQVEGVAGAPLPGLAYKERSGATLTSAARTLVGAEITGFIKFPQAGRYAVAANANDGIRIFVGGKMVSEDTDAHPMRQSPPGEIAVEGDTWYPLRILYFQRRGGWGLELLWAPAGQKLAVVPEAALARPR